MPAKSPKSTALPVVENSIKLIIFKFACPFGLCTPPAVIPLVGLAQQVASALAFVKSQKSIALPKVAIVI